MLHKKICPTDRLSPTDKVLQLGSSIRWGYLNLTILFVIRRYNSDQSSQRI
jgi:hypothetical protein